MSYPTEFLDSLSSHPQGITLTALLERHPDVTRRTAQRRLRELVSDGHVEALGESRARRYRTQRCVYQTPERSPQYSIAEEPGDYQGIPLSMDARDVLEYVSAPLTEREPVGYKPQFLASYEPNRTFYLPAVVRRQLHGVGVGIAAENPAGTFVRSVLERLLIDLSWASSHLEGNKYTWLDTARLVEQGQIAEGKHDIETRMILNHKRAIELLVENIDIAGFNNHTVMNLHGRLAAGLLSDVDSIGQVRSGLVHIGRSVYQPLGTKHQLQEHLAVVLDKASRIEDPFEQSFFVMVHLPYLQPFLDVNKRTSRLLANLPMFKSNLCPLTFLDVPAKAYSLAMLGVYEMNRVELLRDLYVWAYGRSAQRYIVVEDAIGNVDGILLKYDAWLAQVIHEIIKQPNRDPLDIIDKSLPVIQSANERQHMREVAIFQLKHLHEGRIMSFKVSLEEYAVWRDVHRIR